MKVPVSWLKDYIKEPFEINDLVCRLTMAGTEVASVIDMAQSWEGVCVGQVSQVNPHPNADRLRLVTVDSGLEKHEVVCGADNVAAGQKIAFAEVGARLIDGYTGDITTLKQAKIRGVVSCGMVCSEKELGLSDEHEGILVLPADAPLGMPLKEYMGETVLDLDVTPNRPDILSVTGVAREVAALLRTSAMVPEPDFKGEGSSILDEVTVEIKAPDLCPRYSASLIKGVTIGESPDWLKKRLLNAGVRPISNVVDATNYVMLEYGQPLHAFDFDKIAGAKIIVNRARDGSKFTTLDEVERELTGEMLMICDAGTQIAIAGVMGGFNSEISQNTTSVLLESASFNPASIHYTGSRLGLSSAASQRFERGLSPFLTLPALKKATSLILEVAGGVACRGLIDEAPGLKPHPGIEVDISRVNALLGTEYSRDTITRALELIECEIGPGGHSGQLKVVPPYWRSDINLEADVIEEVARIEGYENIPMTMLSKSIPQQTPDPMLGFKRKLLESMTGLGFQEILNWSMTNKTALGRALNQAQLEVEPLHLKKPMTTEQECLRTSLRPGLLASLASNRRFEEGAMKLFEAGAVYLPAQEGLPQEPWMLAGILCSSQVKEHWDEEPEQADFFTAKGMVEALLDLLGVKPFFEPGSDNGFKSGNQAEVIVDGERVGIIGEVHNRVARAFDIDEPVFMFEINATRLMPLTVRDKKFKPIPRYPSVVRDIAIVVDASITNRQVLDVIAEFPLVVKTGIFDVYTGKHIPEGKKSMAYRLTFQSDKKTLTDEAVDRVLNQVLRRLEDRLGAVLRR